MKRPDSVIRILPSGDRELKLADDPDGAYPATMKFGNHPTGGFQVQVKMQVGEQQMGAGIYLDEAQVRDLRDFADDLLRLAE